MFCGVFGVGSWGEKRTLVVFFLPLLHKLAEGKFSQVCDTEKVQGPDVAGAQESLQLSLCLCSRLPWSGEVCVSQN